MGKTTSVIEFHPIASIFPLMEGAPFDSLVADIKARGLKHSIWIFEGKILDGRNRYRACQKLDLNPKTQAFEGSKIEALEFVWSENKERRHLTSSQASCCVVEFEEMHAEFVGELKADAKERQTAHLKRGQRKPNPVPQIIGERNKHAKETDAQLAKMHGTNRTYIPEARKLKKEDPDAFEEVKSGKKPIPKVRKEKKKQAKEDQRKQAAADAAKMKLPDDCGVKHGDFQTIAADLDNDSVDLIFTDPPYLRKTLHLYEPLAEVGARVLKPGGSLICYVGHYALPEVIAMMTKHLRYWWTLMCLHTGKSARMTEYGIVVKYKPMLWFVKGTRGNKNAFVEDVIQSAPSDKDLHDWQQGLPEAEYCIESLTIPNDLVFDPFCGSGTTAAAAKKLHRRWLTCDKEEDAVHIARKRIT